MPTFRTNASTIYEAFESSFITAILGPRRVGKSTLVQRYSQLHPEKKWVFLNMDELEQRNSIENNQLRSTIETTTLQKIGGDFLIWVIIDEAQKCPPLFEQIKILYDEFKEKRKIKFILTGSAILQLHQLSAETLAGRIQLFNLREFSLREAASLYNPLIQIPDISILDEILKNNAYDDISKKIEELSPFKKILQNSLQQQFLWGGMPEALALKSDKERHQYYANYLQTYLEKDIRHIDTISDIKLYQNLIKIIAQQTGSLREDKKIMEALHCSINTLKKYRGYLGATLLYTEIYPFVASSLRRLTKSPKAYITNNGLITYLSGMDNFSVLEQTGRIGHRMENWFLNELNICLDRDYKNHQIYFWRTSNGKEVDFIIERSPDIFPFEVTFGKNIFGSKVKSLQIFLDEKNKAKYGFYIYNGEYHFDEKLKIHFIPAWAIC